VSALSLGKHNPRLKEIRRAVRGDSLTADGLLPIEGPHLVAEAIASGLAMPEIYVRKDSGTNLVPPGRSAFELEEDAFGKIQSSESSQGIVALVRIPSFELSRIARNPRGPIVLFGGLQDPGNVGTILRTAEAFEASGCVGLRHTVSVYNPKAVRASAGSIFRMPHVWDLDFDHVLAMLRAAGIRMVVTAAAGPGAAVAIGDWSWTEPTAVLIGNEGRGVEPEMAARCDAVLRIPHSAKVESLNAAIAATLVLYEAYRRGSETKGMR
jgi:TrmH family RNA methyltransferase